MDRGASVTRTQRRTNFYLAKRDDLEDVKGVEGLEIGAAFLVRIPIISGDTDETEKTRNELIEPIIEKLRQQARSGVSPKVVAINGAVKSPGEYPLIGDGSLSEMIQLAGGFADGAYLGRAEIRRLVIKDGAEAVVSMIPVNLAKMETGSLEVAAIGHGQNKRNSKLFHQ